MRAGPVLLALAALLTAGSAVADVRLNSEADGAYTVGVTPWRDIPFRTVVRQQYDYSCGSAAVATLLKHHYGEDVGEADVFRAMWATGDKAKIQKVGFSLLDMKRFLEERGWKADGYRMGLDRLERGGVPAIALIDLGSYRHFVVVKGVRGDRVLVGDPALGLKTYAKADFEKMWNRVLFVPRPPAGRTAAFNLASEWRKWSPTPFDRALDEPSLAQFTRDSSPTLYQIVPVFGPIDVPPVGL